MFELLKNLFGLKRVEELTNRIEKVEEKLSSLESFFNKKFEEIDKGTKAQISEMKALTLKESKKLEEISNNIDTNIIPAIEELINCATNQQAIQELKNMKKRVLSNRTRALNKSAEIKKKA